MFPSYRNQSIDWLMIGTHSDSLNFDKYFVNLTHFMPLISFYTIRKDQKTFVFLMFSGRIERGQWHEMGQREVRLHVFSPQFRLVFSPLV